MYQLVLMTRAECELCDQALSLFHELNQQRRACGQNLLAAPRAANISCSTQLTARYDWSIPVLYRCHTQLDAAAGDTLLASDYGALLAALANDLELDNGIRSSVSNSRLGAASISGANIGESVDDADAKRWSLDAHPAHCNELFWPFPLSRLREFLS